MEKVQVKVVSIREIKSSPDIYWLLLEEVNGSRRAPILIGKLEAQTISLYLQEIETPVPLVHHVFAKVTDAFKIVLKDVLIFSKKDGLFAAELTWQKMHEVVVIESRASDAVALAISSGAPIYMEETIFNQVEQVVHIKKQPLVEQLEELNDTELAELLQEQIDNEAFELAAKIRDEINRRKTRT